MSEAKKNSFRYEFHELHSCHFNPIAEECIESEEDDDTLTIIRCGKN